MNPLLNVFFVLQAFPLDFSNLFQHGFSSHFQKLIVNLILGLFRQLHHFGNEVSFGKLLRHIQKFFHLPFPFPVSKDKSSQQNQCPYNQDQYYCGNRIAAHQQKYSECSHTNKVRQQKWQPVFPISSAVHIVYPCRCFVLIKSVRPMPASFSRMRLILTLKALSSTYN